MRKTYGYAMTYPEGVSSNPADPGKDLYDDLLLIFQNLNSVINNSPNRIGGDLFIITKLNSEIMHINTWNCIF